MTAEVSTPVGRPAAGRLDRGAVRVAWVLVLGGLMVVLDVTVTNVAIGHLSAAMHAPLPLIQWVTTGYGLALVAVMPASGWATGRWGAKRVYLVALGLFTAGSVLTGLAWDVTSLIGFRVLQGLGGGLVMPVAMTLAVRAAPPAQRGRIMAITGIPVLIAPAAGPTFGGWILDALSWRWVFFLNLPIGLAAMVLVALVLRPEPPNRTRRLDLPGLLMLSPGLAALIFGLASAGERGRLTDPSVLVPALVGFVLVLGFVRRSLLTPHPLIDLRLLFHRSTGAGALVLGLFAGAYFGSMFLLPLYYQVVRGESAAMSGLLMLPQAVATGLTLQLAGRLIDRLPAARVVGTAIAVAVAGFAVVALNLDADTPYPVLLIALAVAGAGVGATMMPTITTAVRALDDAQTPSGTTLMQVTSQSAAAAGTAACSVLLGLGLTARLPGLTDDGVGALYRLPPDAVHDLAPRLAAAFRDTYWLPVGSMTAALLAAVFLLPRTRP
jgi:EmrB/QacA subfamily drug resistance transporter